jgi:hypothetical protein
MVGNRDLDEIVVVLPGVLQGQMLVELSPGYSPGVSFSGVAVSSREFKETIARLRTSALDKSLTSAIALTMALVAVRTLPWNGVATRRELS